MIGDLSLVPLTKLTSESLKLLSERLNPRKALPTVGPNQLTRHRDWRGIASLVYISTEGAASINECSDKIGKVIEIWSSRNDGTATIGCLIDFLQLLDRYDVCEDLLDLAKNNRLIAQENRNNCTQVVLAVDGSDKNIITYDDKLFGTPQIYHAYVLYAKEDKEFVEELLTRMRSEGFKMCTEEDLLAGHATQFQPVSRLIAERCRYIVLVYSPDFLRSPAIAFYMNLAQADSIIKKQSKIIPLMYRECVLPSHLAYYHSLRYSHDSAHARTPYNFWERLSSSLRIMDGPRLNSASSTHSVASIYEIQQSATNGLPQVNGYQCNHLVLPEVPADTSSMIDLRRLHVEPPNSCDTKSLDSTSQSSEGKKKKTGPLSKLIKTFRGKKHKKVIVIEN